MLLFACSTLLVTRMEAQSAARISVQGTLKSSTGAAVSDGDYSMTFRLYTASSGGSALWTETATVAVVGGVYSHLLGSVTTLNSSHFGNRLFLGVTVAGAELTPRTELTYSPYALSVAGIASNGQSASFDANGKLIVSDKLRVTGSLEVPGGISGSLSVSGSISGSSISSSGSITGTSLNLGSGSISAGAITGSTISGTHSGSWTGNFSATNISGAHSGTWSGTLATPSSITTSGTLSVGGAGTPSGVEIAIGDSDTGIEQVSEGVLNIKTNGQSRLYMNNFNVGVNNTSPQANLHVGSTGSRSVNTVTSNYFHHSFDDGDGTRERNNGNYSRVVGIFDGDVLVDGDIASANGFTYSDARTKNILGRSEARKDLDILNKIRITDYRMIDRVTDDKDYKKVIAQEVEEVFPQAVKTSRRVIPNIYEQAVNFRYEEGLLTVTTGKLHDFASGDEVGLVTPEDPLAKFRVISVKDAHTFTVAAEKAPENVFVYGKYVDDFKSVDYDALSMLNISATQEMYRQLQQLQQENAALRAANGNFENRLGKLEAMLNSGAPGIGASEKR
ncbi:MAG: hypothetical protein RLZ62_264 [Bacteroidota bacterium]